MSDALRPEAAVIPASSPRASRRARTPLIGAVAAIVLISLVGIAAIIFHLSGGRWFVVETPSMGSAAPVGSILLTVPAPELGIERGDIITFRPPALDTVYTHRVVDISAAGIHTKGDINGAVDPWPLTGADILGSAVAVFPGAGFLLRALPIYLLGSIALFLGTQYLKSPRARASVRVTGLSLLFSITAILVKPFTGMVLLTNTVDQGSAQMTVVSTGLLPIRVQAKNGTHVDLLSGEVGTIIANGPSAGGRFDISAAVYLEPIGWAIALAFCSIPIIYCLVVGFPADPIPEDNEL